MTFADKGAVADIEPAFFIGYLRQVNATGTLKFEDAPIQRAIYFREGRILFSSSNAPEDQLGAILVSAGKIRQDEFDAIVAALEPKQSVAAALAQGGHVSQRDIGDAARKKVEQIVGACCAQTTGGYEFEDGVLPKGALDLKLTTEKVLSAAFDALEPSGFLMRVLKSPMAVLAQGRIVPVDPDLARLREALDGVSNLADIGGAVGLPLAATEARAAVLVVLDGASVVTSQIEDMTLPETGETSPDLGTLSLADDSEQIQAETIAFGQAQDLTAGAVTETTAAMSLAEIPQAPGSGDSTLVMAPELSSDLGVSPSGIPLGSGTRRARPSTQDLDAVKELLGSKTPSRPTSAKIPTDHWEPVLSSAGRPSRERGGRSGLIEKPLVRQVGGALLLVAVLALGWLAYEVNRNNARPAPARAPSPSAPIPSPATVADGSGGVPTPVAEPSVAATAPAASASAAVVTTPAPLPPTTPTPRATPTPTPKPPVSVATPTPAPAPAAVARPATSGSGYEAMKTGRLADAASIFAAAARSRAGEFSVQLVVACSAQTIEKALQNDPSPDLFVLPATVSGKACHRLMRGFYRTGAEAEQAVASLPPYYVAEGAKPRAIAVKAVLP